jgi:hypothetical protein
MAAGDRIFSLRGATLGGTAIAGASHAQFQLTGVKQVDSGDAEFAGDAEVQCNHHSLPVTVYTKSLNGAMTAIAAAAGALVLQTKGAGAANEKITIKSVKFFDFDRVVIPAHDDGGGVQAFAITGQGLWATGDTPALMIVAASDAG